MRQLTRPQGENTLAIVTRLVISQAARIYIIGKTVSKHERSKGELVRASG